MRCWLHQPPREADDDGPSLDDDAISERRGLEPQQHSDQQQRLYTDASREETCILWSGQSPERTLLKYNLESLAHPSRVNAARIRRSTTRQRSSHASRVPASDPCSQPRFRSTRCQPHLPRTPCPGLPSPTPSPARHEVKRGRVQTPHPNFPYLVILAG